jgi:hypothetical protein
MAHTGYPVAFITTAGGGLDVAGDATQWVKNNFAYAAMTALVGTSGIGTNGVKGVLAHLGPNAEGSASTLAQATYNAAIDTLAANIAVDLTNAPKVAIVIHGQMNTGSPPDRRTALDNIRAAIIQAWDDNLAIVPGPVLTEQSYSDGVHPSTDAQLLLIARRWWVAIKETWYGEVVGYGRGPRFISATIDGARTTITINVDRDLATGTTYGGFRVVESGVAAIITSVTRINNRQVAILVASPIRVISATTVSFASQNDAVGQTIPLSTAITLPDINTVQLPLEPFFNRSLGGRRRLIGPRHLVRW